MDPVQGEAARRRRPPHRRRRLSTTAPAAAPATARRRHSSPACALARTGRRFWVSWLPVLLLLLGAQMRLLQWYGDRSLWLDEALIARSLVSRDYVELVAEPLQGDQAAPVLWLWASRLSIDLLGTGERALRLVSLLAGLAVLLLAWRLARRLLPATLVPVALALVVLSPSLLYFSNEVKPYALDTAVVLALLLIGLRTRADVRPLALAGVVAVWASFAAVFALAGLSAVLVLEAGRRRGARAAAHAAAWLSGWLASLALAYALVLHRLPDSHVLTTFWADTFPHGPADLPAWLGRRAVELTRDPLHLSVWPLALVLLGIGVWTLFRRRPRGALLALSPVPFAVVAAAAGAYPFAGRLALWLTPLAAVALAAALHAPRGHALRVLLGGVALAVVAADLARTTLPQSVRVLERNELRPVMQELSQVRRPDELVLVDIAAKAPFDFYATRTGIGRDGIITFASPEEVGGRCNDPAALRTGRFATQRVWVVFAHQLQDTARLGTREDLLARLQDVAGMARTIERTGARAVLLDPDAPAGPPSTEPRNPKRCLQVVRTAPATGG